MFILRLAFRRLIARPGSTLISLLLFAIGVSIISLLLMADRQMKLSVERNLAGIDLVVGAKGSPLQLILSSVLHADYPTGNIPLSQAEALARHPLVEKSVPLALGDSYRGFRIVGTTIDYPQMYNVSLQRGEWYSHVLEATIGWQVARLTGLDLGSRFYGVHGFQETGHAHPEFVYTVTGVMEPAGNVIDYLILTPVESVWKVHETHHHDHHDCEHDHAHHDCDHDHAHHDCDHDHAHHDCNHDHDHAHHDCDHDHDHHPASHSTASVQREKSAGGDQLSENPPSAGEDAAMQQLRKRIEAGEEVTREEMELFLAYQSQAPSAGHDTREITAMLIKFRSPAGHVQLPRMINETTSMQAASPALELNRLFRLLAFGFDTLRIIAWAIILVSGLNIFMLLWNMLRRGLAEVALIRVLGGSSPTVFAMLLLQGAIIAAGGWILGVVMARAIWLMLPSFHFMPVSAAAGLLQGEVWLLLWALATGLVASLLPAWKAYRTDVHFTLTQPENA